MEALRGYFESATGRVYWIDDDGIAHREDHPDEWDESAVCCSICDGLGHGYPGGRPCPLEDRGSWEPEWAM